MPCDAFVTERAIYLPHRPPTVSFFKASCVYKQYSDYLLRQQVFVVAILEYYIFRMYTKI